jgi:hypothetical protein
MRMRARIQTGSCPSRITNPATAGAVGPIAHIQKMIEDCGCSIHSAPEECILADELEVP